MSFHNDYSTPQHHGISRPSLPSQFSGGGGGGGGEQQQQGRGGDETRATLEQMVSTVAGDSPFSNMIASSVGSAAQGAQTRLSQYATLDGAKRYFQVSTGYVRRKLTLLLFPFSSTHAWQQNKLLPVEDDNAPDLYIPLMAFISYILLVAISIGISKVESFSPEVIGRTASNALAVILLEVATLKIAFYLLGLTSSLALLDLLALTGYIFVSACFTLVGLISCQIFESPDQQSLYQVSDEIQSLDISEQTISLGDEQLSSPTSTSTSSSQMSTAHAFYYGMFLYTATMSAIFIYKSLAVRIQNDQSDGMTEISQSLQLRQKYLLIAIAFLQYLMAYALSG